MIDNLGTSMTNKSNSSADQSATPPAIGERSRRDVMVMAAKIVCSIFPLGSTAVEILNAVFTPAVTKRSQEWIDYIVRRLADLEGSVAGLTLEGLAKNDNFVSIFVQATQAAMRTHNQTKREYLGNAVINAARGVDVDHDLQPAFIRFVDEFNILHVTLLTFVRDNSEILADFEQVSSYKLLRRRYLEQYNHVGATREEFALAVEDLKSRALLSVSLRVRTYSGVFEYMLPSVEHGGSAAPFSVWRPGPMVEVTSLGHEFLRFISEGKNNGE